MRDDEIETIVGQDWFDTEEMLKISEGLTRTPNGRESSLLKDEEGSTWMVERKETNAQMLVRPLLPHAHLQKTFCPEP